VNLKAGSVCYVAGVDPTANQDDDQPASDRETFQLEFDVKAEQWRVRTADNQYWSVEASGGIQATGTAQYCFNSVLINSAALVGTGRGSFQGQEVAVVEQFVYLSSLIHSLAQSTPDIRRSNAVTRTAMLKLDNQIWNSFKNLCRRCLDHISQALTSVQNKDISCY